MPSQKDKRDAYTEFDLLDEHHVDVQKILLDDGDTTKLFGIKTYESNASVGHSQWCECNSQHFEFNSNRNRGHRGS